jgi:hypothetical protein
MNFTGSPAATGSPTGTGSPAATGSPTGTGSPAAAGSPAATGSPTATNYHVSYKQVVGTDGFVFPKPKPVIKRKPAIHSNIAFDFEWPKFSDGKTDMSTITKNLEKLFQKEKVAPVNNHNVKVTKVALVKTPYVKHDQTGMYVVTHTGDNSGMLNPDVNDRLDWQKNVPYDMIKSKYCEEVLDSIYNILSVQCKQYILLNVTKGTQADHPYDFNFMRLNCR